MILRNCKFCGDPFTPNRDWQLYCTIDCHEKFHARQQRQIRAWWKEEQADKERLLKELEQRSASA